MLALIATLAGTLTAAGFLLRRRRRFTALDWPDQLGFNAFSDRVARYMVSQGWTLERLPYSPWPFLAERGGKRLVLLCCSRERLHSESMIHDLAAFQNDLPKMKIGKIYEALISITSEPLTPELREAAEAANLNMLHYKSLHTLAAMRLPEREAIETLFGTGSSDAAGCLRRSKRCLEALDLDGAERFARLAAERGGQEPAIFGHLSDVLARRGATAEALGIALEGLARFPEDAWSHLRVSRLRLASGDPDGAEQAARGALALAPGQPLILGHMADVLARRGDDAGALSAAEQAVEADVTSGIARLRLSKLHLAAGDLAKAETLAREAAGLAPENAYVLTHLSTVLQRLGRPAEAIAPARQAVTLRAADPWVQVHLARAMLAGGERDSAHQAAEAALAVAAGNPDVLLAISEVLTGLGQTQNALRLARQVEVVRPADVWLKVRIARLHLDQRDTDAARACAQAALSLPSIGQKAVTSLEAVLRACECPESDTQATTQAERAS